MVTCVRVASCGIVWCRGFRWLSCWVRGSDGCRAAGLVIQCMPLQVLCPRFALHVVCLLVPAMHEALLEVSLSKCMSSRSQRWAFEAKQEELLGMGGRTC